MIIDVDNVDAVVNEYFVDYIAIYLAITMTRINVKSK